MGIKRNQGKTRGTSKTKFLKTKTSKGAFGFRSRGLKGGSVGGTSGG